MNAAMVKASSDPLLKVWRQVHRPVCPSCRNKAEPLEACARVWAPEWAGMAYPECADELEDPMEELTVLRREVEELRRENASLRESAREDFAAANNWRRFVAMVGQKRASMYLVPPKKEDSN